MRRDRARSAQLLRVAQSALERFASSATCSGKAVPSLVIGLSFLALCSSSARTCCSRVSEAARYEGAAGELDHLWLGGDVASNGDPTFTGGGPCDAKAALFRKLSTMPVEVRYPDAPAASASK